MRWCSTSVRQVDAPIDQMCQVNCNDQIAARAFGAVKHVSPLDFDQLKTYDVVFATMWKICESFETRWMQVLHRLKDHTATKVVLFQEAETSWPMTRSFEEQKSLIELLRKVDLFLTHNERDCRLWGSFAKKCYLWRTCIDISHAIQRRIEPQDKIATKSPILFGSSYNHRANGLTGLIACKDLGRPLWHHDRSNGYEEQNRMMPEVCGVKVDKEIPHSGWFDWLDGIAGAYIAVHPMPAAAAGRDQIAFAALGIPCIGNFELDIQRHLFPELSQIDIYDPLLIKDRVLWLIGNPDSYNHCRNHAMREVEMYGLASAVEQAKLIKVRAGFDMETT